jgi:LuxR family transcriptional regulator, maltose regulon positive regulatory protein
VHYVKACILLAGGTPQNRVEGITLITTLLDIAERTFHTRLQIALLAVRALALQVRGHEQAAHTAITGALALAELGGFIRTFVDLDQRMQALLAQEAVRPAVDSPALAYIRRILAAFPAPARAGSTPAGHGNHAPGSLELNHLRLPPGEPLTARELEILVLMSGRLSDKEIAHTLSIATSTVHRHIANLYDKLGVNRRWDAVAKAQALGLLPR